MHDLHCYCRPQQLILSKKTSVLPTEKKPQSDRVGKKVDVTLALSVSGRKVSVSERESGAASVGGM